MNILLFNNNFLPKIDGMVFRIKMFLDIIDKDYIPVRKFKGPIFLSGYGLWVDWRINKRLSENIEQIKDKKQLETLL